jgi:ABC-type Fe3+-siderophore transport system permease subunit
VRDIIDQTYDTTECRERCLNIHPAPILIVGGALAWNIRSLRDAMYRDKEIGIVVATGGILVLAANSAVFWSFISATLDDPRVPEGMKRVLLLLTGAIFSAVARAMVDLIQYTAQSRKTVREDVTKAAERVHSLTPDTEPATDYNLVKEEL